MIRFANGQGHTEIIAKSLTSAESQDLKIITVTQPELSTEVVISGKDIVDKTTESDIDDITSEIDSVLGDRKDKLINLGSLYYYHRMLMKNLSGTKLEANVCTKCNGLLDENLKCIFCGTQHRLVCNQ